MASFAMKGMTGADGNWDQRIKRLKKERGEEARKIQ
jgi:hypothetical protein